MTFMKTTSFCFLVLAGLALFSQKALASEAAAGAAAQEIQDLEAYKTFITGLGDKTIEIITTYKDQAKRQRQEFESLFEEHFAVKNIATFVLGRYARRASTEEKKRFFHLFKKSIAEIYSSRFRNYSNEKFQVKRAAVSGGKSEIIRVFSEIKRENGAPIDVEWHVIKHKGKSGKPCDEKMLVLDVIVEGLSMSVTERSEYSSIIENNGGTVTALNDTLEKNLEQETFELGDKFVTAAAEKAAA